MTTTVRNCIKVPQFHISFKACRDAIACAKYCKWLKTSHACAWSVSGAGDRDTWQAWPPVWCLFRSGRADRPRLVSSGRVIIVRLSVPRPLRTRRSALFRPLIFPPLSHSHRVCPHPASDRWKGEGGGRGLCPRPITRAHRYEGSAHRLFLTTSMGNLSGRQQRWWSTAARSEVTSGWTD